MLTKRSVALLILEDINQDFHKIFSLQEVAPSLVLTAKSVDQGYGVL